VVVILLGQAKSLLFFEVDQAHIFHAMISPFSAANFPVSHNFPMF
jgi:hypothetical protein